MDRLVREALDGILKGESLSPEEARELLNVPLDDLIGGANKLREEFHGVGISLCAIINAKSGLCSEDCKFCSQASHHSCDIQIFPLKRGSKIIEGAKAAILMKTRHFGIVTSGRRLGPEEIDEVCMAVSAVSEMDGTSPCASLGELSVGGLEKLKESGLNRYHHNLECSRDFFPSICTTHTWEDRLRTAVAAKKAGLEICCGGIFGLGERWEDRIDLAFTLRELDVDSVPLNFLIPIKGTPLESRKPVSAREALRIIALFRYILPKGEIKIAAGREFVLGDLQSLVFSAGASGMMVGDYLTTKGRRVEDDFRMIERLGLEII